MRHLVITAFLVAAPQLAAAADLSVTAQSVPHFRALAPQAVAKADGLTIEGGYCRVARLAARPHAVRIVKIDSSGRETASAVTRLTGAMGNRSQGCGFYSALTGWSLAAGETVKVTPIL